MTPEDAESVLRERLIDAGAKFKGRFPSATEVGDGSSLDLTDRFKQRVRSIPRGRYEGSELGAIFDNQDMPSLYHPSDGGTVKRSLFYLIYPLWLELVRTDEPRFDRFISK